MKFSEKTLAILKNFASINPSIVFRPGTRLKTMSPQRTVIAEAVIPDDIPSVACIYDISRFLSIYNLYTDPDVEFHDKFFMISQGKQKTKYVFADQSMVIAPPEDKQWKLPSEEVKVSLTWANLSNVIKASGVLQLPEIAFVGSDGSCFLKAIDSENPTADAFGIEVGTSNDTFQMIIKTEYLKLIPQDYEVSLSSKGISKFESSDVSYFIAIDSKSTYSKGE